MTGAQEKHEHGDGSHAEDNHVLPRLTIVPRRYTKTIHLIRHGEGFHNVAGHKDERLYGSWEYEDAHLTPRGWRQAWALNRHIKQLGGRFRADVVIISPLTRTLETAVGVFGMGPWKPGMPQPPLMLEQTELPGKRSAHPAVSAAGCSPMVAWEGCRECLCTNPCDKRRSMREIAPSFPAVDFSLIESDADVLWKPDGRESHDEMRRRGHKFMHWLYQRPEKHIAVVSHSVFLFFMMSVFGHSAAPHVQNELHKWYENCEMRTVIVADDGGAHPHPDSLYFHGGSRVGS